MIRISGLIFIEKQQNKVAGDLIIDEHGIASLSTLLNKSFQVCQLKVSPRINDTTRFITLPNGSLFETSDNNSIDNMLGRFANQPKKRRLSLKYPVFILLLSMFILTSWSLIHYGLPSLSRYVAMKIPSEILIEQGQQAFQSMDQSSFSASKLTQQRQNEITAAFKRLLPLSSDTYNYQLHFRSSEDIGANAFALPSGDIVITDDLVNLATSIDEINSVLLHEIAHVELRHSMQSVVQTSALLLGVVALTGDITSLSTIFFAIPALLLNSNYSRNMEIESDDYSLVYMLEHNVDPIAFSNILSKLIDSHQDNKDDSVSVEQKSDYWASHPPSDERIERFKLESKKYQQTGLEIR